MADGPHRHVYRAGALALVAACCLGVFPVAGQAPLGDPDPVFLDMRRAAKFAISQEKPEYPPLAKLNYIQGRVRMQVTVTKEGHVREAHVVRGHPFLAVAALKVVRNWLFRPAKERTGPEEFQTYVDVKFTLRFKKPDQLPSLPEQDLTRQVRPPEVLERPASPPNAASVRLRLLVSSEGRVLDSQVLVGHAPYVAAARSIVAGWKFRPARWGALAVPWYIDVDVPVETRPAPQATAGAGAR